MSARTTATVCPRCGAGQQRSAAATLAPAEKPAKMPSEAGQAPRGGDGVVVGHVRYAVDEVRIEQRQVGHRVAAALDAVVRVDDRPPAAPRPLRLDDVAGDRRAGAP